jgi:maleylacetate reductase
MRLRDIAPTAASPLTSHTFMIRFQLTPRTHQVIFGEPLVDVLRRELPQRESGTFYLLTTPGMARRFEALAPEDIRKRCIGRFTEAVPHVPSEVADLACEAVSAANAKLILVVGGGSALDTAKAVAHRLATPIMAVPTNFSGSEVTYNFGLTTAGVKQTVIDPKVLPQTVIYDPSMLSSLSAQVAVCSGVNAIAHAIEAIYAINANPMTRAIAETGIRNLVAGLEVRGSAGSADANAQCLLGAWLCGEVLAQVGMGLHHRICHVLGGTYKLPHAATHTVLLPYSIEFNYGAAPALSTLADLFGGVSLAAGLAAFSRRLQAPSNLRELGFLPADIAQAARLAVATPLSNPRPVTQADVEQILAKALIGSQPS